MASSSTVHASERSKIEQIAVEFFAKSLHIILESRIPALGGESYLGSSASSSASGQKTRDRWFNLALGDCTSALENFEPWRRSFSDPMVVDILLDHLTSSDRKLAGPTVAPSDQLHWAKGGLNTPEGSSTTTAHKATILERWTVQFEQHKRSSMLGSSSAPKGASGATVGTIRDARTEGRVQARREAQEARIDPSEVVFGSGSGPRSQKSRIDDTAARGGGLPLPPHVTEVSAVYKRILIMLRSLYSRCRLLPAYRMFRILSSPTNCCDFSLSYRVLSSASPLSEHESKEISVYDFTPVETVFGKMCLSVEYRLNTAVIALEVVPSILHRIIPDYVGSPTTDPLKRFTGEPHSLPASGMPIGHAMNMVCVPSSLQNSPPGLLMGRRHSWSGGVHQVQQVLQPPSPSYRISRSPSPSFPFHYSPPPPPSPYSHYSQKNPSSDLSFSPLSSPLSTSADRHSGIPTKVSQPISIDNRCSPPFSPSPSPSPPTMYRGSDPVSIPRPFQSRGSKLSMGDTNQRSRNLLPPLSSSAKKAGVLLRSCSESPGYSGQSSSHAHRPRSFESSLQLQDNLGQQKTLSRSSSKTGFRGDDGEDDDFSCPFAVDDVDAEEKSSSQMENLGRSGEPPESSTSLASLHRQRSPDAAVGVLIQTLKSAAPLRHTRFVGGEAANSSLMFGANERELVVHETSRVPPSTLELTGKMVSEGLQELQLYRNIRDHMQLRREEDMRHASSRSRAPPE